MPKTSTKRKAISKKDIEKVRDSLMNMNTSEKPFPLLRTTKTPQELEKYMEDKSIYDAGFKAGVLEGGATREVELFPDAEATAAQVKSWDEVNEPISLTNKITWVLTAVNVAIVVYLTIKNI
jgi:hypothetical protein